MTASYNGEIHIKGTKEEIKKVVNLVYYYYQGRENGKSIYFDGFALKKRQNNGKENVYDARFLMPDKLKMDEFLGRISNEIFIEIDGPYGGFNELTEFSFYEELAKAIPNAWFDGQFNGWCGSADQEMLFELSDKCMKTSFHYSDSEESSSNDEGYKISYYYPLDNKWTDNKI